MISARVARPEAVGARDSIFSFFFFLFAPYDTPSTEITLHYKP